MAEQDVMTAPLGSVCNPYTGKKSKGKKQKIEFIELQKKYHAELKAKKDREIDQAQGLNSKAKRVHSTGEPYVG